MKKLIQICAFSLLVFAFAFSEASARTQYGSEVTIPFAFNVGERSYESGKYIIKVSRLSGGGETLMIQDPKNDTVQTVLLTATGDSTNPDELRLDFETVNGQKYLSKIRTPQRGFALNVSKGEKNVSSSRNEGAVLPGTASGLF
jgi:hypothetical protein